MVHTLLHEQKALCFGNLENRDVFTELQGRIYAFSEIQCLLRTMCWIASICEPFITLINNSRGLFCFWAVRELNTSLSELSRKLQMTPAGVGYAVQRGESIIRTFGHSLLN